MTQEAKRRITKFDFTGEGAHVALVDAAANEQSVLIMKAKEAVDTKPVEDVVDATQDETTQLEVSEMDGVELKKAIAAQVEAALLKAKEAHKAELASKDAEIAKAKEIAAAAEEAKEAELVKAMHRKAVNYTAFGVKNTTVFAKAMFAVSKSEEGQLVLAALEKAAELNEDRIEFSEVGASVDEEVVESGLKAALRKSIAAGE